MKIYTYYEDINTELQKELLELWIYSWRKNGFEPVILTETNARENSFYNEFIQKIQDIYIKIRNKTISPYELACHKRWLSYAMQDEERFYFSDYDVINNGFVPEEPIEKLHFMDDCCPCFGTAKASEIKRLCETIINISYENIEKLNKKNIETYHDQDFLVHHREQLIQTDWINFSRNRPKLCSFYNYKQDNSKSLVIHFANYNMMLIQKENPMIENISRNNLRILFIKELLKI